MNGRGGVFKFFLFLILGVIILIQVLLMMQSDRLYERVNVLIRRVEAGRGTGRDDSAHVSSVPRQLPMKSVLGDKGDTLVLHLSGEPRTLNPLTSEAETSTRNITTGSIFERLLEYDRDEAVLKPWLAESYEMSGDGLEMTVRLRDDVCFSDGVKMTADDIVFTYKTIMNPGVDAAVQRMFYGTFKDVVKIDELTAKFIFNKVLWKTFEAVGLFEVLPKHIYQFDDPEQFNKRRSDPFGSGPFAFEKWDVGQEVVLRRNENYWGHKPRLDRIVFKFISNDVAALQAFRSGDVDLLEPTAEQSQEVQGNKEFSEKSKSMTYWSPGVPNFFIAWNQVPPFFKDRRVRLAMTHIVDRGAIAEHLMKGDVKISTGPFYIYGRQNDPNIIPWPYDLKRAGELLDEAGWVDSDGDGIRDKDGVPFRFKLAFSTGRIFYEQLAKLFKDAAGKVGVDVIADPYEWSVFIEKYQKHEFDALVIGSGGTIEYDPYQHFHSSQIADRGDNCTSYSNPEVDALLEQARTTLDESRYELYHKFHRILHEEQPFTFLYIRPERRFIDRRFENVIVHELGINPHEWYVPLAKQKYRD